MAKTNVTARDLREWAASYITDHAKGPYAAKPQGFWFVLEERPDADGCTEYGTPLALVQTSHCADCGNFLLFVDDREGRLWRPNVLGNSEAGETEVTDFWSFRPEQIEGWDF